VLTKVVQEQRARIAEQRLQLAKQSEQFQAERSVRERVEQQLQERLLPLAAEVSRSQKTYSAGSFPTLISIAGK
jgi:hypothetical protein